MEEPVRKIPDPEIHDYEEFKPPIRPKTVLESFRYAIDGILDVFRTQKHMRFHFVTMVLVLLAALLFDLDKRDILILMFVISLVLIAEMFNTAIEAVVDMVVQSYHPLAKFAKDAAAGAVLIATVTAVLMGVMLSVGETGFGSFGDLRPESPPSYMMIMLAGVLLLILVTMVKVLGTRGKLLKGGIVSGHTAAGFFLAATILFVSKNAIAAVLGIIMALLIAQSRVQAKIHSIQEVITGALLAVLLTATVYWFPGLWTKLGHLMPIFGGVVFIGR
ncbi:MAG TPA: diacylglycerol kinase [Armatimonadota bacterium]|nr:diacylglycerol kinase [Armatimonadota bacterium]